MFLINFVGDNMKRKKPFENLSKTAVGLGGLGVTLGASAAVAGRASAGTAASQIMPSFGTIASGAGIATTAMVGHGVIGQVKKLNKKRYSKW